MRSILSFRPTGVELRAMGQLIRGNFFLRCTTYHSLVLQLPREGLCMIRRILQFLWRLSQHTQQDKLSLSRACIYALSAQGQILRLSELGLWERRWRRRLSP